MHHPLSCHQRRRRNSSAGLHAIAAGLAVALSFTLGHPASAQTNASPSPASVKTDAEANAPSLKVTADRADALYAQGDTVTFTIRLANAPDDAEVKWTTSKDGMPPRNTGTAKLVNGEATVKAALNEPGFIFCEATYTYPDSGDAKAKTATVKALGGAGIDPLNIKPSLPVPDDFDAFWAAKKKELAAIPMNARLTPVPAPKTAAGSAKVETFDLQVDSLGAPVSGYYARPAGAQPGTLPAILTVHGAGVRSSSLTGPAGWAARGLIALDINAHGLPNGKPAAYYEDLAKGDLRDYRTRGRESRDTIYFQGMYLRLVRAIDFLTAQPEWDGRTVIVSGGSQGGAQSIVAGGLDPRVTYISAGVPALCDNTGVLVNRQRGWPKFLPGTKEEAEKLPQVIEAVRYYDAMNFATRVKARAYFTVGFIDVTCAPTSVYAAYNNLPGQKEIYNDIANGHRSSAACGKAKNEAIHAYLKTLK
ncbi:acetylxylan esterase [Opitutaceae bacterium TAV4]|nr:acetylxylan esterase [Opitutaceae bacterium TAV4]RRK01861.1 acetylxylan esterase [Opitutaceae bacterium TAV3]